MHSTLRRELCGTPKILQSIRPRPTHRTCSRRRTFSSRTCLLNQPGSKDNSAGCSSPNSKASNTPDDTETSPVDSITSAKNIGASIEKWIQTLSERGQSLDVWDTISEQDENGRRTLLPHIKRDLEKITAQSTRENNGQEFIGLEFRDGRIRALDTNDLKQEKESRSQVSGRAAEFINKHDTGNTENSVSDVSNSSGICDEDSRSDSHLQNQKQHLSQSAVKPGGESLSSIEINTGSKFHGSSAARRQRERYSKTKEKSQSIVLPDWFQKHNVLLRGETAGWPSGGDQIWASRNENLQGLAHGQLVASSELLGSVTSMGSSSMQVVSNENDTENEKVETSAPGSSGSRPESGSTGSQTTEHFSKRTASSLVAIPNAQKRYYIQDGQRTELILTAGGRLRLPATGPVGRKSDGISPHLLVHYAASDGEMFLDRLIEDVTVQLKCDLVTLDVQDISSLILESDNESAFMDEAKSLSYDTYEEIYGDDTQGEESQSTSFDDIEDADEDGSPAPRGFPFFPGRPITIDLKAMFGPGGRKRNEIFSSKDLHQSELGRALLSKGGPPPFFSLVDTILSTPAIRRRISNNTTSHHTANKASAESSLPELLPQDGLIIHIKDLKALHKTDVGKHFISQLHDQIKRRRNNGEKILLIGSSCETGSPVIWDANRIQALQNGDLLEEFCSIVITPPYQRTTAETDSESDMRNELQQSIIPKQDRARRIQTINARHLYEMLQTKAISLPSLQEGFWTTEFSTQLSEADRECLSRSFWSFTYVQRLSAVLASSDFPYSSSHISHAVDILEHSDSLKYDWVKQAQPERVRYGQREQGLQEASHHKMARVRSKATKHEKKLLSGVIESNRINTTFEDIHIPTETVEALQTLTSLSLLRPDAFKYGVLASDRIPGLLLYGPPGTGKTLAAKAVARESGATMLEVSAADINDMYVGEGEKNVQALFSLAKKLSPCVIFLDEADSVLSARRGYGQRVSHRELINQFLKEWDGMNNDSGSAFLMVATNRPMDLDDAVLRRLPRRLLIDLPSEKDRAEILKIHLRHERLASDVDLVGLAARTQFYSGSDLKNVAVAAALACVREENDLAKKKQSGDKHCVYPDQRTLTMTHFDKALEEISASISDDMTSLREMKKFDEQFGDRKGRKRKSPRWGFKTSAEADAVLDTIKVRP